MEPRQDRPELPAQRAGVRGHEPSQDTICAACPVRLRGGFCAFLDPATLSALAERSHRITLEQHAEVEQTGFLIVISGALSEVHINQNGNRRILSTTFPGEPVPPLADPAEIVNEAATPVVLCRIAAANFRRALIQSHAVRRRIGLQARTRKDRANLRALLLASLSPEERLAAFIVESTRFMPWAPLPDGGGVLTMEFDRQDIAALLATSVETICRVLHRLQDRAILTLRDPWTYEIHDMDQLRSVARIVRPETLAPTALQPGKADTKAPMIAVNAGSDAES